MLEPPAGGGRQDLLQMAIWGSRWNIKREGRQKGVQVSILLWAASLPSLLIGMGLLNWRNQEALNCVWQRKVQQ